MSSKAAMIALAIVAFLIAALLVLVIVRMLFGGRLRMPGGRARQARLGIVDAFDLDRQRQLIIVRRDNTEHLIMIGGPNDILIESEIVRVEARDLRDVRRDKDNLTLPVGDGRIPAPIAAERGDVRLVELPPQPIEEPMLPMPVPVQPPAPPLPAEPVVDDKAASTSTNGPLAPIPAAAMNGQVDPAAPRTPTFPLPPRRTAPPPERRPAPPPRLPDSVSRTDDRPPATPNAPMEPGTAPALAPPTSAPPRTAPPFLKPLPPRPPARPLQRSTPQPPVAQSPGAPGIPLSSAPAAPPSGAPAPVIAAAPPRRQPVPEPKKPAESTDALESLEEEMAKLLGRGPG